MTIPCRKLGQTNEDASVLGFGVMRLPWNGPDHSHLDEPRAEALIRRAIEGGVNYFDTAWVYHSAEGVRGPGSSEPFLGRVLEGQRDRVRIATKMPIWLAHDQDDFERILHGQLQKLRTEYIDFYLVHGLEAATWEKTRRLGLLEFLARAKAGGRIGHVGFSFHDTEPVFQKILGGFDWEFAQIQYNYLDRDFQAGDTGLKAAADRGLGVVIMEPLRGGGLANDLPEGARAIFREARPEWSPAEWALRWLWARPEVSVVLSGMGEMGQVEENLKIAAASEAGDFGPAEEAAVARVEEFFRQNLKVGCTGCGYCLPCPYGVLIPQNFLYYNRFHLLNSYSGRRQSWAFYHSLVPKGGRAERCLGCKECRERCPQHLPVPELLGQVARWAETDPR